MSIEDFMQERNKMVELKIKLGKILNEKTVEDIVKECKHFMFRFKVHDDTKTIIEMEIQKIMQLFARCCYFPYCIEDFENSDDKLELILQSSEYITNLQLLYQSIDNFLQMYKTLKEQYSRKYRF